jgi:hypothetical protein
MRAKIDDDDVQAETTTAIAWMREPPAMPNGPPVQVRATSAGSELSRQVPVDLEADADLNERRGAPGHWSSSLAFLNEYVKSGRAGAQSRKSLQFTRAVRRSSVECLRT